MTKEAEQKIVKWQKLLNLVLWVACLILLVLFFQKDAAFIQTSEENLEVQKELLAMHFQLLADEAIISGQPQLARSYLKAIDSLQTNAGQFVQSRLSFMERLALDSSYYARELQRNRADNDRALSQLRALQAKSIENQQRESEILSSELQALEVLQSDLKDSLIRLQSVYQRELNAHQNLSFLNKTNRVFYVGEVRDAMANGRGSGLWQTGGLYTGEWQNNLRHGYGTYRWADGESYEGHFSNDRRNGQGTYYWKNGDVYTGEWLDDRRNGLGELRNAEGKVIARGTWKDDQLITNGRTD